MVQEPPPRCCPKQAMLHVVALRRERKRGVQAKPGRESSASARRSAQRRDEACTRLFKRLEPRARGRMTRPWSSCQTSMSWAHCRRAMIKRQCVT
eukprot:1359943-Amphidinium_carterae.3